MDSHEELLILRGQIQEASDMILFPAAPPEKIETAWREIEEAAARMSEIAGEQNAPARCAWKNIAEKDALSIIEGGNATLGASKPCHECGGFDRECKKFTAEQAEAEI